MKRKLLSLYLIALTLALFAFEWPQENITIDSYDSYFGQNKGSLISTSLIFEDPEQIKAAEDGQILIIMIDNNDYSDFFPSTLGTSVIIAHDDNLLSVYGNLDKDTIEIHDKKQLVTGDIIANGGASSWQSDRNNLEFQIIDTKNSSAINPKVLLSRTESELPLTISGITLANKNGAYFDINTQKSFSSGLYKIYQKRNPKAVPYKTSVLINGVLTDQISYDTVIQENSKICLLGKKKYSTSDVYPNENLQLMGEVMLSPGRTTLGLIVTDIMGASKQLNYNINIY